VSVTSVRESNGHKWISMSNHLTVLHLTSKILFSEPCKDGRCVGLTAYFPLIA